MEDIDEDYAKYISIFISIFFTILVGILVWFILSWQFTEKNEPTEKHVHFSDDYFNKWKEWKTYIMDYVKGLFFKSHVENGILKSTRYMSDSLYAEMFK